MIVVVCPSATVTGGPEALHQLVDSLARQGFDARMLYLPGDYHHVPAPYAGYRVLTCSESDVYPTDTVVLPEVMAGEASRFGYANVVIWWLSVDNADRGALRQAADHACQSRYAWEYVRSAGFQPMILQDYLHREFFEGFAERRPVVAVNPAKGADVIERFRHLCPDIEVVEIKGRERHQVADLLRTVSVFVDFGHQPGRDRLPREAAACGAVVFVRDLGAARFRQDYTLPERFFFDGDDESLIGLGDDIRQVLGDDASAYGEQGLYREGISREAALFDAQVREFASRVR